MEKKKYEIVEEPHKYNGKTYTDLVCYFDKKRFVLVPLTNSAKVKSYFYALLGGYSKK